MTVAEQRSHAPELLDQLDDEFFTTVYAMLEAHLRKHNDGVIGYRVSNKEPILASEADNEFETIVDDVKAGNYVTIDELIAQKSHRQ